MPFSFIFCLLSTTFFGSVSHCLALDRHFCTPRSRTHTFSSAITSLCAFLFVFSKKTHKTVRGACLEPRRSVNNPPRRREIYLFRTWICFESNTHEKGQSAWCPINKRDRLDTFSSAVSIFSLLKTMWLAFATSNTKAVFGCILFSAIHATSGNREASEKETQRITMHTEERNLAKNQTGNKVKRVYKN